MPDIDTALGIDLLDGLLRSLFKIYSPPNEEYEMIASCEAYLLNCGFEVTTDEMGNIMARRGDGPYACLNAHMDAWQDDNTPMDVKYSEKEDSYQLPGRKIGCDDKVGIAIILFLARATTLPMKVLLTVQEEVGCNGVKAIPKEFFSDVLWAFSLDRRGNDDIITEYQSTVMATPAFLKKIEDVSTSLGLKYKKGWGSFADTFEISKYVEAVNLSIGYYGAHIINDYVIKDEVYNCIRLVRNCIIKRAEMGTTVATPHHKPVVFAGWGGEHFGKGGYYSRGVYYSGNYWPKNVSYFEPRDGSDELPLEDDDADEEDVKFDEKYERYIRGVMTLEEEDAFLAEWIKRDDPPTLEEMRELWEAGKVTYADYRAYFSKYYSSMAEWPRAKVVATSGPVKKKKKKKKTLVSTKYEDWDGYYLNA